MKTYFELSLHALVLTGFVAIARTGWLDLATILLFAVAFFASTAHAFRSRPPLLGGRGAVALSTAYIVFFPLDAIFLSGSLVAAVVHLIMFLLATKLAQEKKDRDTFYLIVLSFLLLLAASSLTINMSFVLALALFVAALVSTLMSFEIYRSERNAKVPPTLHGPRRLGTMSIWATFWIVLIGAGFFFMLPRFGTGYFIRAAADSILISGFSDSVELGEIGQVKLSSSLVMRTRLLEGVPLSAPRWRGVALDAFDGRRWYTSLTSRQNVSAIGGDLHTIQAYPAGRETLRFEVFLEPLATSALFAPHQLATITGSFPGLERDRNDSIFMQVPPNRRIRYEVISAPPPLTPVGSAAAENLPAEFDRYLALPEDLDPRIGDLAAEITSGRTAFEKASLLELYLKRNYAYSLELDWDPGDQPLATFLFQAQSGHCEYFASSMAIMLRTVGVPTRLVNGFLPGEFNSIGDSWIVRQSDAHSWVEVWIPGEGWIGFDPTPPSAGSELGITTLLSHYLDAFELFWNSYVLTYDAGTQALFLRGAREVAERLRRGLGTGYQSTITGVERASDAMFLRIEAVIMTAGFWSVVLAFVLAGILYRRRSRLRTSWKLVRYRLGWAPPDREIVAEIFVRAARLAASPGTPPRQPGETWREWVGRLPDGPRHELIGRALEMFEKGVYSPRELTATEFSRLEATVADLGRSLPEARATATPGA